MLTIIYHLLFLLLIAISLYSIGSRFVERGNFSLMLHSSLSSAVGLSMYVFYGGVLIVFNIFNIYTSLIPLLVFLGIFIFENYRTMEYATVRQVFINFIKSKLTVFLFSLFFFIIFSRFFNFNYNAADDAEAYFVFVAQLMDTGSLPDDPFNYHRLASSYGGWTFLQAVSSYVLPLNHSNLLDNVVIYSLIIGLLIGFSQYLKICEEIIGLMCFTYLMFPFAIVNTSPAFCGGFLLVALVVYVYIMFENKELTDRKKILLISFMLTACMTMKAMFIPFCILLSVFIIFLILIGKSKSKIKSIAIFLSGNLIFLIPWMLDLYRSNFTLCYPLLGLGTGGESYGLPFKPSATHSVSTFVQMFSNYVTQPPVLITIVCLLIHQFLNKSFRNNLFLIVLGVAILLFGAIIIYSVGNFTRDMGWPRYQYVYLAFIIFLICILLSKSDSRDSGNHKIILSLLILSSCIFTYWGESRNNFKFNLINIYSGILDYNNPYVDIWNTKRNQLAKIQNLIPKNSSILLEASDPFLADFARNKIFMTTAFKYSSSPAHGMPLYDSERFKEYMIASGIEYILIDNSEYFPIRIKPDIIPLDIIAKEHPWLHKHGLYFNNWFWYHISYLLEKEKIVYQDERYNLIYLK